MAQRCHYDEGGEGYRVMNRGIAKRMIAENLLRRAAAPKRGRGRRANGVAGCVRSAAQLGRSPCAGSAQAFRPCGGTSPAPLESGWPRWRHLRHVSRVAVPARVTHRGRTAGRGSRCR